MSEENFENVTKSDSIFAPTFVNNHKLPDLNFDGYCLIKVINLYISYLLNP